jgi:hypothetical protein
MRSPEFSALVDEINGGASIGATLKFQLLNLAKAMVEQRRPWMILRKTDTSKSVTTANTWQTAIDLSSITEFSRFYETFANAPVKLFNGSNAILEYRQKPWNERLRWKDTPNTFAFDAANKQLYLNGAPIFAGTLYIDYVANSPDIINDDSSTWVFPSWAHPLLAFFAVGIHKGGIDYDDINARMAPDNRATAELITSRLEAWDNELQLSEVSSTDPYSDHDDDYRQGAINMSA